MSIRSSLLLAASLLSLGGCVRDVAYTTVPNPALAGVSSASRVAVSYPVQESRRGLPGGTLDDEATLTRFDANEVCVDIALRAVDEGVGESWSVLENFDIELETNDGRSLTPSGYQSAAATMQQYDGYVPIQVVTRVDRVCTRQNDQGQCTRWTDQPHSETQWVPGVVNVHTGGGGLCFQHGGAINPTTQSLRLSLRRTARRVDFEWMFSQ